MVKRVVFLVLGSLVLTLLLTGVAMAWTPQEIYQDFVDNDGQLTRNYTDAELRAYLNDATIAQYYGGAVKDRLDDAVMDLLNRETFPFTGFQLMIAGIVVVVLIGGGIALRVLSRPRKSSQSS